MIRIAILQDSLSYSVRELLSALERADMQSHVYLWHEQADSLADYDGFILIGNNYSNDSIAPSHSVLQTVKEQSARGKLVLGIGKGAQTLIEMGLVPGLEWNQVGMTLVEGSVGTDSNTTKVQVRLSKGYQWNAFTRRLKPKTVMSMPIFHPKRHFNISPVLLAEIERNGLHIFQYCDEQGAVNQVSTLGDSIHAIAAIANKAGNVMAMLPHPETTLQGDAIFQSMREYIVNGYQAQPNTLNYQPRSSLR